MNRATRSAVDWARYLDAFHAKRPGITEDVLGQCAAVDGTTPYEWLVDGIRADLRVLDIGCGSAPTKPVLGDRWIGIDRSATELRRAAVRRAPVALGDAVHLPIRSHCIDVVVCSMALMLFDPLDAALAEIGRVLVPNGQVRAIVPATAPLTVSDRVAYLRLAFAARRRPRFPLTPLDRSLEPFEAAHLLVTGDEVRRFVYPLSERGAAQSFVDSWYSYPARTADNIPRHRRRSPRTPATIGVGLRRIIALATPSAAGS